MLTNSKLHVVIPVSLWVGILSGPKGEKVKVVSELLRHAKPSTDGTKSKLNAGIPNEKGPLQKEGLFYCCFNPCPKAQILARVPF
jgi:hypothetical protein